VRREPTTSPDALPLQKSSVQLPVDLLNALQHAWQTICEAYDAAADLPDMTTLFEGADLTTPIRASETVVAHMLLAVMEHIPFYSPWHIKPLGLRRIQDETQHCARWALSGVTYRQWRGILEPLSIAIEHNVGLILAADLVDSLMSEESTVETCIAIAGRCIPRRVLRIKPTTLDNADIVCDACQQPFRPIKTIDADQGNSRRVE
jgi:hypothetical protein